MNFLFTMLKIFYAGTMAVYPSMNMYGSGIIQSVQAGYRMANHFGLINSHRPLSPGPVNEQGSYAWWQDATAIFQNMAPVVQNLLKSTGR
ncbi:MAG TPA: hypothetical protein VNU93_04885 [Verrucomicrobiae bacterium]|nr:hypothetical protein [Verrucomicrobiae bacterium]